MINPFQLVAERLAEYGFFGFMLPWLITSAVFYGLLKKSGIFSSEMINGLLSISVAFFIWGYLISPVAVELTTPLSTFFTQLSIIVVVFLFGLVAISMFHPDLGKTLSEVVKGGSFIWIGVVIVVLLLFMSGLGGIVFRIGKGVAGDITVLFYVLLVFMIGLFILGSIKSGGE